MDWGHAGPRHEFRPCQAHELRNADRARAVAPGRVSSANDLSSGLSQRRRAEDSLDTLLLDRLANPADAWLPQLGRVTVLSPVTRAGESRCRDVRTGR